MLILAIFLCNAVKCNESWSSVISTTTPIRPEEVKKICLASSGISLEMSGEVNVP